MGYELAKQIKNHEKLRSSFFQLAEEIFEIPLEAWYKGGFWTERYVPYAFVQDGCLAANASVNVIDTTWKGSEKRLIQIGTVMTHPEHRGLGLAGGLLREILLDWQEKCDGIYLYANDTVLDFYPKLGFEKAVEYQWQRNTEGSDQPGSFSGQWERLCLDEPASAALLRSQYERSNPFSALPMTDNFGLLMFYCGFSLKDCIYYSRQYDAVCIVESDGQTVTLYDVFGGATCSLNQLIAALPFSGGTQVKLGFMPKDEALLERRKAETEDSTLFVYGAKENLFRDNSICMPLVSHA